VYNRLGDRIVPVMSRTQEKSVLCTRDSFDAEEECRKNLDKNKTWPLSGQAPHNLAFGNIDFDSCEDVAKKADKFCQFKFSAGDEILQNGNMHMLIKNSGAVTVMFWFRMSQEEANPTIANEITFYRSVFPRRRLLRMSLAVGGQFELYGTCGQTSSGDSMCC
jgi:hypothetical protein